MISLTQEKDWGAGGAGAERVVALEEEIDIEVPDAAAEHIQTVGDAVKFIDEKTAG